MTDVVAPIDQNQKAISYINSLIEKGEELNKVSSHPGKTREFIEWKNSVDTYIQRKYDTSSSMWSRVAQVICFPKWFNNDIHGNGSPTRIEVVENINKPTGFVISDAEASDRKAALRIYKDGLQELIAILKSVQEDFEVNGLPPEPHSSKSSVQAFHTTISPTFSQSQNQSQQQVVSVKQEIQKLLTMVEAKYGEEKTKEAKTLLSELEKDHGKWSTVEKVTKFFLQLGRDAFVSLLPLLVQILLKLPQGM